MSLPNAEKPAPPVRELRGRQDEIDFAAVEDFTDFFAMDDDEEEEEVEVKAELEALLTDSIETVEKKAPKVDMQWMVQQQSVDGHFKFSPDDGRFANYVDLVTAIRGKLTGLNQLDAIIATILAMVVFEKEFPEKKGEWSFMYNKAELYVKKQLSKQGSSLTVDDLKIATSS